MDASGEASYTSGNAPKMLRLIDPALQPSRATHPKCLDPERSHPSIVVGSPLFITIVMTLSKL